MPCDGSMPSYGAYTSGRVVNIHLKKEYDGIELLLQDMGTMDGGGGSREATFSGGIGKGKLHAIFWLNASETGELTAAQRSFSSSQDYTLEGGQDFRVPWGFPAVVEAVSGNLAGLKDGNGNPVSVALVPLNQGGVELTPSQFVPEPYFSSGTAPSASGQRTFDTARYLPLVSPSIRTSWQTLRLISYTPTATLSSRRQRVRNSKPQRREWAAARNSSIRNDARPCCTQPLRPGR